MSEPIQPNRAALCQVKEIRVPFSEHDLLLRTSTVAQQRALLEVVSALDPTPLVEMSRPFLDARNASVLDGVEDAMQRDGVAFIRAILNFLKTAATDLLALGAAVALDNEANYRWLKAGEKEFTAEPRRVAGRYLECSEFREYVAAFITPAQAFNVLQEAFRLNQYSELGKALMGMVAAKTSSPTTTTTEPTPSVDSPPVMAADRLARLAPEDPVLESPASAIEG